MRQAPIGIFDSGVGGLTVARAVIDQLPGESVLYIGDTAHGPYGPLSIAQIRAHALRVMDDLVDSGVKMLVIACNSASAAVLRDARERYTETHGIPVVEVIQPAVRRAVAITANHKVGVIGTRATIKSRAYDDAFAAATHLELTSRPAPRFVEFVEAGITAGTAVLDAAEEYLAPVRNAGVDTLVLGCTHYPLLSGVIQYVMGDAVTLVSSAEETAKDVYRALVAHNLAAPAGTRPEHRFLATGDPSSFQALARRFLGPQVKAASAVEITGEIPAITPQREADLRGGAGSVPAREPAPGRGAGNAREEAGAVVTGSGE